MYEISRRDCLKSLGAGMASTAFSHPSWGVEIGHRERIEAALSGQPTDRTPFGYWTHWPNHDRSPGILARLTVELQQRLGLDFVKFSPYGLYSAVDWGLELKFAGDRAPIAGKSPISAPGDWLKVKPVRADAGEYLVLLEAQRLTLSALRGKRVPLIQTIFSPATTAAKLVGYFPPLENHDLFLRYLMDSPRQIHSALEAMAETTRKFVENVVNEGADGIFFANQWVDCDLMSPALYNEFCKPYDLHVLEALKGKSWFNVFHLHAKQINFDGVLDYPVNCFNWHDRDYGPSIKKMRELTDKCLMGGITPRENGALVSGTPEDVENEVHDAIRQSGGRGFILAPGEVVHAGAKLENFVEIPRAIRSFRT